MKKVQSKTRFPKLDEMTDNIGPNASGLKRFGAAFIKSFKDLGSVFGK